MISPQHVSGLISCHTSDIHNGANRLTCIEALKKRPACMKQCECQSVVGYTRITERTQSFEAQRHENEQHNHHFLLSFDALNS